jgi:N-acetylglutamate synthase-like GNAT family acetyltransferase
VTDTDVRIVTLADRPDLFPTVGRWHWEEWGAGAPNVSLAEWTDALRAKSGREGIPITWIALVDGAPVGSVALIERDMPTYPDLTPWLSSVYVVPERRKDGVGSALVAHAEAAARGLGVARLYLYTDSAEPFYAARGWRTIAREHYDRSLKAVMAKDLEPAAAPQS